MNATTLQLRLKEAGFDPGPVDGRLGDKTAAALKAFQTAHGLAPSGVLEVGTLARLVQLRSASALSNAARRRLSSVHPDLQKVVLRALTGGELAFTVAEGARSAARQEALVASGASKTRNSRHLTGHAVDLAVIVDGEVRWDWPLYKHLASSMKAASMELGVPIEWGGDWRTFKDGPHFQLPWAKYPAGWGETSPEARSRQDKA